MGNLNFFTQSNPILLKIISIPFCIVISILIFKSTEYLFRKISYKKKKITMFYLEGILIFVILIDYIFINNKNMILVNFSCIFSLIYCVLEFGIHIKEYRKIKESNAQIEKLEIFNKTLNIKYDELSAFHHDFNNIIQTIGGLLYIGKYDNLKRYYRGLKADCQTINDMEKFNLKQIKNPEILTLIVNKYELAKQNGIRMNLEFYSELNILNSDIFQIIRILGILLDNAIEATKECNEKNLNIEFRIKENIQSIIIENTYSNKDVNTECIFKKGFSTKNGNRGLGLWKVNKIIKYHKNLKLHTYKKKDFFVQKLDIVI